MIVLVGPFDKTIVDVVACNAGTGITRSQDQPGRADTVCNRIALEKVVARDHAVIAPQKRKVAKPCGAVVAPHSRDAHRERAVDGERVRDKTDVRVCSRYEGVTRVERLGG